MGGPDACEVNDSCSGDSPLQIQAAAQEETSMDLSIPSTNFMPYVDDDGQLQNSDVTLLWHELTVYCHSTDDGVDDYTVTVCACVCLHVPMMKGGRTDGRHMRVCLPATWTKLTDGHTRLLPYAH